MSHDARSTAVVELHLPATTASAPRARHAIVDALARGVFRDRADDAAIAVSELVTNAVLHGREPIVVRVLEAGDAVRVEVADGSPMSPAFSMLDPTAVTGRGLLLVSAVADGWGVEPSERGKVVWFVLEDVRQSQAEADDIESLLASWADDLSVDPALEQVRVVITDVDTAAMAAAEMHTEAMLRELALAASDRPSDRIASMLVSAAEPLEATRADIRRQLAAARWRAEPSVDITLTVAREDAELVRDFLHALDEADRLSRRGHLLTVPTPDDVSEQRQAFLRRVLDQLRS